MHEQNGDKTRNNILVYLSVGVLVLVFFYHGLTGGFDGPSSSVGRPMISVAKAGSVPVAELIEAELIGQADRIERFAETDHIGLLKESLRDYQRNMQDYQCTLYKQERINGRLKPTEKIAVSFRNEPFSVLMEWQENAGMIDKLLYVEGQNDNQMIVHPTGLLAWIKSVKRDPAGDQAKKSSRRTCNQFGFYRAMESLLEVYEKAEDRGELGMKLLGRTKVSGRDCIAMERALPASEDYPCGRMVMEFDIEYCVPVAVSSYDWQGELLSRYVYEDLRLNTGLSAAGFEPAANGL